MQEITRRDFMTLAGSVSVTAALARGAWGSTTHRATGRLAMPQPNDLCLIFPGSWLFFFETGPDGQKRLRAVTPDDADHDYFYGKSGAGKLGRTPVVQGEPYVVTINRVAPLDPSITPSALVAPLVKSGSGFMYSPLVTYKGGDAAKLRTVLFPLPDLINAAGTVTTTATVLDPSIVLPGTAMGANGLAQMPSAYVFRYQNTGGAKLTRAGASMSLGAQDHLQFRVLRKINDTATMTTCAPCNAASDTSDIQHAEMSFQALMGLMNFPPNLQPQVRPASACHGSQAPPVVGINPGEYGFIPECPTPGHPRSGHVKTFGVNLGACGNSAGIGGSGD